MDLSGWPKSYRAALARPSPVFSVSMLEDILEQHTTQDTETGCWNWKHRLTTGKQYGTFAIGRWSFGAHRLIYENVFGPIDPRLAVDHDCCNKRCVNPEHLEAVTREENLKRGGFAKKHLREPQHG